MLTPSVLIIFCLSLYQASAESFLMGHMGQSQIIYPLGIGIGLNVFVKKNK